MAFSYKQSLDRIRDARNKRSKTSLTQKFFMALKQENRAMPSFDADLHSVLPYSATEDDHYTNTVVMPHVPLEYRRGRVAKSVTADGNCLFNAASVALIGNESLATELRVRIVIEMTGFFDSYMKEFELVDFEGLCGVTYEEDIHQCAIDGGDVSARAICGLASVIERPLWTVYPSTINGDNDELAELLNRCHRPRRHFDMERHQPIVVMWTRTNIIPHMPGMMWRPNHFVPLVENCHDSSLMDLDLMGHNCGIDETSPSSSRPVPASRSHPPISPSSPHPVPAPRTCPIPAPRRNSPAASSFQPVPAPRLSQLLSASSASALLSPSLSRVDTLSSVTVMATARNKPCIGYQGYTYRLDKLGKLDSLYFRCTVRGCPGRVRTDEDYSNPEVRNANHQHAPCPAEVAVREVTHKMRQRAKESTDAISTIYRQCAAPLAALPEAAAILPSLYSIDSSLYRQRHRLMAPLPQSRTGLIVPNVYRTTTAGEDFLLYQSNNSDSLVFATPSNLRDLCHADIITIDGTFDAAPALYTQLFTLHAFEHGKLLPLVYCLLSSKERAAYAEVFRILKTKAQEVNISFAPATIMSDYESGMIAAVREEFPNAHHQGCYFHFTQAIWRQVQHLGLVHLYTAEEEIRRHIRHLMALGFVECDRVRAAYSLLRTAAPVVLHPLYAYFEQQWLGNVALAMWNVSDTDIRTNNACEGWHNRFNRAVNKHHPNTWHLLRCIVDEQASTDIMRCQIAAGQDVLREVRKYATMKKRIMMIRERYRSGTIDVLKYIDSISHNLKV